MSTNFANTAKIAGDLTRELPEWHGAIGFLFCDSEIDYGALVAEVAKRTDFPVVGGTTLLFPASWDIAEYSAKLLVVWRPGMQVSVAVSGPVGPDNLQEEAELLYRSCREGLSGEPKMYFTMLPMLMGPARGEPFLTALFSAVGQTPVFGGMSSAEADEGQAAVFAGGEAYADRVVLVGLGGDLRPVFAAHTRVSVISDYAPVVTKSENNIVYEVDGRKFCDYLDKLGIKVYETTDGMEALFQYGPLPVRLMGKTPDEEGVPEIRGIAATDAETGSAAFTSDVPEGIRISMGVMEKGDIRKTTQECVQELNQKMDENSRDGYEYSAQFCISCISRYFAQVGGRNMEGDDLRRMMRKSCPVAGFYAFCEAGPPMRGKRVNNRTHANSIVMCAL